MSNVPEKTQEHYPGPPSQSNASAEVLLAVFPEARVLEVPAANVPIGRAWFAAYGLDDRRISTNHIMFDRAGGVLHLRDAGSTNGTFVNGRRLAPGERAQLAEGTVVRAGFTVLVHRRRLAGERTPVAPLGGLVGPFGLRELAMDVEALIQRRTRNVLVVGESGTGKELLAAEIARRLRPQAPFITVNIAAIPTNVFESQLFGHTRGAFSGADRDSRGVIGEADGGCVFLDEIGELPIELQPKLLRLLENNEVHPVGAPRSRRVDVTVIGATNRTVEELVQGVFRRDLYARFAYGVVRLPPLRARVEDLFEIARVRHGLIPAEVEVEALERLLLDDWPENIRGLDNVIQRALARSDDRRTVRARAVQSVLGDVTSQRPVLSKEMAEKAVEAAHGNKSKAARSLGIHLSKLRRLLGD